MAAGALGASVTSAAAQVVYTTGSPPDCPGNAWEMSGFNEAMSFVLDADAGVTGAHIWTTFQNGEDPLPDNGFKGFFDWTFFADDGSGLPGAVIASGRSVPTLTSRDVWGPGFDLSEWDVPMAPTTLSAGTRYWLGLHNTSASGDYTITNLYWCGSVGPNTNPPSASQFGGTGAWVSNPETDADYFGYGNRLAMSLYATPTTVPEPSGLALLGTGIVGVVPFVRRKRR